MNRFMMFVLGWFVMFCPPLFAQESTDDQQPADKENQVSKTPRVHGVMNFRYRYDDLLDLNSFDIRRARIDVRGNMTSKLEYRVFAEFGSGTPKLLNAHLQWKFNDDLTLLVGQYKIPFTLEGPHQFSELEMIDFSLPVTSLSNYNDALAGITANGRDIGISLIGKLFRRDGFSLINYNIGVFNGAGINTVDNNKAKDFVGLLTFNPTKHISLAVSHYNGTAGQQDNTFQRVRSSFGARYDDGRLLFRSEYIFGKTSKTNSDGLYAVAGYFVHPKIQPVLKYEYFQSNTKIKDTRQENFIVGINYIPRKNMCYQLNYTRKIFSETQGNYIAAQIWLRF